MLLTYIGIIEGVSPIQDNNGREMILVETTDLESTLMRSFYFSTNHIEELEASLGKHISINFIHYEYPNSHKGYHTSILKVDDVVPYKILDTCSPWLNIHKWRDCK